MKTRLIVTLAALALGVLFAGCVSSSAPGTVTSTQQTVANAVEDTISIGLVPVLTKNPSYTESARGVAVALASFSGDTLAPADVSAFLAKTSLSPEDARAVAGIVNAAWDTYSRRYAQQVSGTIRPDVKLFLGAVANGINRAVTAIAPPANS